MEGGYVALLDVLGFSANILAGSEHARLPQYLDELSVVLDAADRVDSVVFSDSIVLTIDDSSEAGLRELARTVSWLLGHMLTKEIPLRGAIAHGSYFRRASKSGAFVAGRAIVEAYRWETAQDWVGVMLAPSVLRMVPDLRSRCELVSPNNPVQFEALEPKLPWAAFMQAWPAIPLHTARPLVDVEHYDGYAIVPSLGDCAPHAMWSSLTKSLEMLRALKELAPDPGAQGKHQRTIDWLRHLTQTVWSQIEYYARTRAEWS